MLTCSLQSGSNGNCIYVETPDTRLLFDAGISGLTAQRRLAAHQRNIADVEALIISHDHSDHVSSAGVFQRKFNIPLYITPKTFRASQKLGTLHTVNYFQPGQTLMFRQTSVHTIPTPHDGVDGVAFVIRYKNKSLGVFTDLGHRFAQLESAIKNLSALYLESNYDPDMLENGPYPSWLKNRIRGSRGHLSNEEASRLVLDIRPNLQFLILAHLSEHNNHPDLALGTAKSILPSTLPLFYAPRYEPSPMYSVE